MTRPIPLNEAERLAEVVELDILDSPREPSFDALVELAVEMLGMKMGLLSIVDRDRQWIKAGCGTDMQETSRADAFCSHAIMSDDPLVVEDALLDERFRDNPLVRGRPFIRFYAGVPLSVRPGVAVGSLCVLDDKPRRLSAIGRSTLRRLADVARMLLLGHMNARKMEKVAEELRARHAEIERQKERLELQKRVVDAGSQLANMGAWEFDLQTGQYSWSDSMYVLHGLPRDHPLTLESVHRLYPEHERRRLQDAIEHATRTNGEFKFEGQMDAADGTRKVVRILSRVELANGVPVRRYGWKQDITEEHAARQKLIDLAERDPLTGLLNRNRFKDHVAEQLAAGVNPAVVLFDLDGFKDINDSYGHALGDAFLVEIARRLRRFPLDSVVAARLGGDEFALCLPHTDRLEMAILAEWLCAEIRRPWLWGARTFELTTSVGIAHLEGAPAGLDDLIRYADLALYAAKQSGRNGYRFYDETMREEADRRMEVLHDFRRALRAGGDVVLHYQPKVDLRTGRIAGLEALLRWQRADGTVLGPGAFKDAFHDTALSDRIGTHVLTQALAAASRWHACGLPFGSIAINLSALQFRDQDLADVILHGIGEAGIPARCLQVEITEEVLLSNRFSRAVESIDTLRRAGVKVAFDDFGTGYASLTHLCDFPVDIIKIDRSFVTGLDRQSRKKAITASVIELARSLDLEVVAEGIETPAQRDIIRSLGCRFGQGYLLGRPVDAAAMEARLAAGDAGARRAGS
ncbi:putative bifunctional diguanylate cyclase/phosphodiesterase [Aquibium microcysteis]|uniref:putative bifunctional diguanylate cyclase/phosphodiesterase n=1 Tax=Aquibium microcysteis TaxID=675281 RepID=UPI00165D174E|nr:sensor domain-containing phosphodiesterase [Aquibium microcysteis]